MREIKFRVFIKNNFFYWGFIDNQFVGLPNVSGLSQVDVMKTNQQFTGVLDKNGKEVFEGDIIHNPKNSCPGSIKWETVYGEEMGDEQALGFNIQPEWTKENLEVIGNIYENPELIKS